MAMTTTNRTWRPIVLATLAPALIALVGPAAPSRLGNSDLSWYTIDGGGDMWTLGGDFELSGTAGQPDASTAALTGGEFELTGGFWVPFAARVKPVPPSSVEPADDVLEQAEPEPLPPP
jgi:hypothetical protein